MNALDYMISQISTMKFYDSIIKSVIDIIQNTREILTHFLEEKCFKNTA